MKISAKEFEVAYQGAAKGGTYKIKQEYLDLASDWGSVLEFFPAFTSDIMKRIKKMHDEDKD